jgi:hypothetical protein
MLRLRKVDSVPGALRWRLPAIAATLATDPQDLSLYLMIKEGTYLFDPKRPYPGAPVVSGDFRSLHLAALDKPFLPPDALIEFVFAVAIQFEEPGSVSRKVERSYYSEEAGTIAAAVYRLAASLELACWIHDCDKVALATRLSVGTSQRILFVQTVGYPAHWQDAYGADARPTKRVSAP